MSGYPTYQGLGHEGASARYNFIRYAETVVVNDEKNKDTPGPSRPSVGLPDGLVDARLSLPGFSAFGH